MNSALTRLPLCLLDSVRTCQWQAEEAKQIRTNPLVLPAAASLAHSGGDNIATGTSPSSESPTSKGLLFSIEVFLGPRTGTQGDIQAVTKASSVSFKPTTGPDRRAEAAAAVRPGSRGRTGRAGSPRPQ